MCHTAQLISNPIGLRIQLYVVRLRKKVKCGTREILTWGLQIHTGKREDGTGKHRRKRGCAYAASIQLFRASPAFSGDGKTFSGTENVHFPGFQS